MAGRKNIIERGAIMTGSQMTSSFFSNPTDTSTIDYGSFTFTWSGSAIGGSAISGSLQCQAGQDMAVVGPWSTQNVALFTSGANFWSGTVSASSSTAYITSDTPIAPQINYYNVNQGFSTMPIAITGSSGVIQVAFTSFPYRWVRWQYNAITGSGTMTGSLYAKLIGA